MLVRVKKGLGNYGHIQDGYIQPKNYASGAFSVSDAKGKELISRGIVDAVEESTAPAAPVIEASLPEKPAATVKKSPQKTAKTAKKAAKKAENPADDAPKFDATGGVE